MRIQLVTFLTTSFLLVACGGDGTKSASKGRSSSSREGASASGKVQASEGLSELESSDTYDVERDLTGDSNSAAIREERSSDDESLGGADGGQDVGTDLIDSDSTIDPDDYRAYDPALAEFEDEQERLNSTRKEPETFLQKLASYQRFSTFLSLSVLSAAAVYYFFIRDRGVAKKVDEKKKQQQKKKKKDKDKKKNKKKKNSDSDSDSDSDSAADQVTGDLGGKDKDKDKVKVKKRRVRKKNINTKNNTKNNTKSKKGKK